MYKLTSILFVLISLAVSIFAQAPSSPGGMALGPARFELEMKPGTETTVVVNLDYKAGDNITQPARIVATLNDWTITKNGRVEYFPAGTQPNSASPWLIYSPGEAAVTPGTIHQIRVTISGSGERNTRRSPHRSHHRTASRNSQIRQKCPPDDR
ncbi:MAG: hypothetical protein IPK98_15060 [Chloracidobacterium sp.]|nr:hypothetical protein [Chloracidobacterium sp.]